MDINELQEAWKLASEKHNGQKYGGPKMNQEIEYLEHIRSVLFEVQNALNNDTSINERKAILGAIFHDLLEDTDCEKEYIKSVYGEEILEIVESLTKNEELNSKVEMMKDSLSRIKHTCKEASIVKMADRISKLYSPPYYWEKDRMKEYLIEAKMIHKYLSPASEYLGNRLSMKIKEYETKYLYETK